MVVYIKILCKLKLERMDQMEDVERKLEQMQHKLLQLRSVCQTATALRIAFLYAFLFCHLTS